MGSYYDDQKNVIGYAIDICTKLADAVKSELRMESFEIKLHPVTPQTRIPHVENGTVDLECGSTTNNLVRQKQVSFTMTHFVTASRFVSKKTNNLTTVDDLKGKTVVAIPGSTNSKQITELNVQKGLGMNIVPAADYAAAFKMVETDAADAFATDDIPLYGLVAMSSAPDDYTLSSDALSVEPYGIMLRRDDPAFKKVVDAEMSRMFKSGEIHGIYEKWFLRPIPPKGVNLNVPMSEALKRVFAKPTDSGDPFIY